MDKNQKIRSYMNIQEGIGFMAKIGDIKSRFMLDDHHKMERFCVLFVAFCVALASMFGICLKIHADNQKLHLSTTALYTSSSTFSLSNDVVNFEGIYRNSDYTKSFVLMKTETMQDLSIDANDYQIFMTTSDGKGVQGTPTAGIYVFGTTGYIGLYFANPAVFQPAMYNIVVRCNAVVPSDIESTAASNYNDISFQNFNQIQFFTNFAGSNAPTAEFLDNDEATVRDIYYELFLSGSAQSSKRSMSSSLAKMNSYMQRINEYRRRLETLNVEVPALPAAISGDYITTDPELTIDNPTDFDPSMLNSVDAFLSTEYNITVNTDAGDDSEFVTGDMLYLVTDYVFPGGYQYNYQDLDAVRGSLDSIVPMGLTYPEWKQMKSDEAEDYSDISLSFGTWYDKSGVVIDMSGTDVASSNVMTAINNYMDAVKQLYNLKRNYQTSMIFNAIEPEVSIETVASIFSISSTANTLITY